MRYKWIELTNYAGIFNGMQLYSIKIDFTKCRTNKIIIRGLNGSGKSTLMGAINVHADGNDKFIDGMEARKTICIVNKDIEYVIKYIHPVNANGSRGTTKAYISKTIQGNVVELNPNGNVTSCKDIIYNEFNLDASFMQLSALSSEDRGLVSKKPAERKKLLNSIMESLDVYNNIYKTFNKKHAIFKANVNQLVAKIDQLGDKTQLDLKLANISARLQQLNASKDANVAKSAQVALQEQNACEFLRSANYYANEDERKSLEASIQSLQKYISSEFGDIDIGNIAIELEALRERKAQLEITIQSNQHSIDLTLSKLDAKTSQVQSDQTRLQSLQSETNYVDVIRFKEAAEQKIAECEQFFSTMRLQNVDLITKSDFDYAMQSISDLKEYAAALILTYGTSEVSGVYSNRNKYIDMIRQLASRKNKITSMKSELDSLRALHAEYEAARPIIAILSNRPSDCSINDCTFIKAALEAQSKYPEEKHNKLCVDIQVLEDAIEREQAIVESTYAAQQLLASIETIEAKLKNDMRFISKLPVRSDFAETFMQRIIEGDRFLDIDELYRFIDCGNLLEEYRVAQDNLKKYNAEYAVYESKNSIIESISNTISEMEQDIQALYGEVSSYEQVMNQNRIALTEVNDKIEKYNRLLSVVTDELTPKMNRIEELTQLSSKFNQVNADVVAMQTQLTQLSAELQQINNEIESLMAVKEEVNHSIRLLAEYDADLKMYQSKANVIEVLRKYSSPTTGIQVTFMKLYMDKTINLANSLLSVLFDGEFTLKPFVINDSEFRIPCVGNGMPHDDISSMSTAQQCMISMIVSFALLYQSSTEYNIIKLDELDAFLDTNNRSSFIDLLDKLMSLLSCEQCFIVSHNNELASYNCDIIMLKNNGTYIPSANENIIWEA